jgi:signal transduction histidine kinase
MTVSDMTRQREAEEAHRRVLRRLVSAQEAERGRIARELHDEFGQQLAALSLGLKRIGEELPNRSPARPHLGQSLVCVGNLLRDLHRLVWNLRPPALDDLGLGAALEQHLKEWKEVSGIDVRFHSGGSGGRRLPSEVETTLYRIAQEALTNVSKHARATRVSVLIDDREDHVGLIVEDNGKGFDVTAYWPCGPQANGHLGLRGMEERVRLAAGTMEIESTPGVGTTVFVRIPIGPEAAAANHPPSAHL